VPVTVPGAVPVAPPEPAVPVVFCAAAAPIDRAAAIAALLVINANRFFMSPSFHPIDTPTFGARDVPSSAEP
jgi:hypothetical protein